MGRQFFAVVPAGLKDNHELKQLLGKLKRTMKERGQAVRWTPPDLWHVTVQFLGELEPTQEQKVRDLFSRWSPPVSKLELRLHGVGAFPSEDAARVLWLGVQENQALLALQADLTERLVEAAIPLGDREFKPHLTLGRFRNVINVSDLTSLGGRKHFGDYKLSELILFESVLQGNIIKYVPQQRRSLSS